MTVYRNIFLAAGAVAISYLMLKLFKIQKEKTRVANKELYKEEKEVNKKKKWDMNEGKELGKELKKRTADAITIENSKSKKKLKRKIYRKDKAAMQYLRPKPNFFIGFQIYEAGIHQKVQKLQEQIIAKNPKLHSALIQMSTLHVTLAVTHLANENDIKRIKEKLDEWAEANVTSFFQEPFTLSFTGIKTFGNAVAYVDIEPNANKEKLLSLSQNMKDVLSCAGFSTEKKDFKPHLTILKLSKNYELLKAKKSFHDDFESLKSCKEHFGKQEIHSLQLLSMDEPKDENGYYKCFHQIFVRDPKIELGHGDSFFPGPESIKLPLQKNEKIPPVGFNSES